MRKSSELRKLYEKIELDFTDDRLLLSKVKNGSASKEEIDELLDIVKANPNGGKILDKIKIFENTLVTDINEQLDALDEMEDEYLDVAHIEDESEQNLRYTDMKKRYKRYIANADELIDAIKIAYFQIGDFTKYEDRLYNLKESLAFFE